MEAVAVVPAHHRIITLAGEELGAFEIVERTNLALREDLHPARAAPVQQMEAFAFEPARDFRTDRVEHVLQLRIGLQEERHGQDIDARIDLRETGWHEEGRIQLSHAHQRDYGRFGALGAVREDTQLHAAAGRLLRCCAHLHQRLVPCRIRRSEGRELQLDWGLCRHRHGQERPENDSNEHL
jgi:hypothetical protein